MTDNLCPATVVDRDGYEQPCEREVTGWCWYEGDAHEPSLYPACWVHEDEGGRRMAEAEAAIARVRDAVANLEALTAGEDGAGLRTWPEAHRHAYLLGIEEAQGILLRALDGEGGE